jgi:predicted DNA-binding transcriptional regulator
MIKDAEITIYNNLVHENYNMRVAAWAFPIASLLTIETGLVHFGGCVINRDAEQT